MSKICISTAKLQLWNARRNRDIRYKLITSPRTASRTTQLPSHHGEQDKCHPSSYKASDLRPRASSKTRKVFHEDRPMTCSEHDYESNSKFSAGAAIYEKCQTKTIPSLIAWWHMLDLGAGVGWVWRQLLALNETLEQNSYGGAAHR